MRPPTRQSPRVVADAGLLGLKLDLRPVQHQPQLLRRVPQPWLGGLHVDVIAARVVVANDELVALGVDAGKLESPLQSHFDIVKNDQPAPLGIHGHVQCQVRRQRGRRHGKNLQ